MGENKRVSVHFAFIVRSRWYSVECCSALEFFTKFGVGNALPFLLSCMKLYLHVTKPDGITDVKSALVISRVSFAMIIYNLLLLTNNNNNNYYYYCLLLLF
jgi:hypothetical protein